MSNKKFNISFVLVVHKDNNILSSYEADHEEDVADLLEGLLHDVDDVKVQNLSVEER
jgi:hypothetical protein